MFLLPWDTKQQFLFRKDPDPVRACVCVYCLCVYWCSYLFCFCICTCIFLSVSGLFMGLRLLQVFAPAVIVSHAITRQGAYLTCSALRALGQFTGRKKRREIAGSFARLCPNRDLASCSFFCCFNTREGVWLFLLAIPSERISI